MHPLLSKANLDVTIVGRTVSNPIRYDVALPNGQRLNNVDEQFLTSQSLESYHESEVPSEQ